MLTLEQDVANHRAHCEDLLTLSEFAGEPAWVVSFHEMAVEEGLFDANGIATIEMNADFLDYWPELECVRTIKIQEFEDGSVCGAAICR